MSRCRLPSSLSSPKVAFQKRLLAHAVSVASVGFVATAVPVIAQENIHDQTSESRDFSISAGPMDKALSQLASTAGITLSFDPQQLSTLTSPGLKGNFSISEALDALLSGSGFQAMRTRSGGYSVVKKANAAQGMVLDPLRIQSDVEVRFGDAPAEPGGFKAEYQTTATKTPLPLRETPQAVSVVTGESLEARQVQNLANAVELSPSVSSFATGIIGSGPDVFGGKGQKSNSFNIRGQNVDVRTDGFRDATFYGDDNNVDIAAFERVEVLRGPSGFYGRGSLGGFINKVRKKPRAEFDASISAHVGSYDNYRTEGGITGALNANKRIRGRVDFAYEDAGAFTDEIESERKFVAPSFEAVINDKTRLLLQFLYQKDDYDANPGVPLQIVGDQIEVFDQFSSRTALYGDLSDRSSKETRMATLTVNHELSDRWLASLYLQGQKQKTDFTLGSYVSFYYGYFDNSHRKDENEAEEWAGELRFQGSFDSFGREHKALFGMEINERETTRGWGYSFDYLYIDPVSFSGDLSVFTALPSSDIPTLFTNDNNAKNQAIYGQAIMSLHDRTRLLIGARYDEAEVDNVANFGSTPETDSADDAWTGRLGLMQTFSENINAYAIYAESFTPSPGVDRNGNPLDPETGAGFEVGLKAEWLDKKLAFDLALYRQELDNRPIPDPENENFVVSSGVHRADGVELEINGSFYPGWTIGAAASWMDNEFTESDDPNSGLSINGTFDNQFSLYTGYELEQGKLAGLGMGATFIQVGERKYIRDSRQVYLEGYHRLDLNVSYTGVPNWDVNLLVRNVTDEEYFVDGSSSVNNYWGSPRSALLKVTFRFD